MFSTVLNSVLGFISTALVAYMLKELKKLKTNNQMTNSLALSAMTRIYEDCKQNGKTELKKMQFYDLYDKYIKNGGNSYAKDLNKKFSKL